MMSVFSVLFLSLSLFMISVSGILDPFRGDYDVHHVTKEIRGKNYNRHRPPLVNGTSPVDVFLWLEIVTILDVSEFGQSFTVDMEYKLRWRDHRLRLSSLTESDFPLILDTSWRDKIWIPDIYFKNALESKLVQGTITPITHIEVRRNGDVSLIARLTVQLICDMELFAYPHDRQQCFLDSTSLSYEPNRVNLQWDRFAVDETIYFPKFKIDSYTTSSNCSSPDIHKVGKKSCVRGIVNLSRKVSFYVTRFYAPTLLITSATFLGYFIKTSAVPARVGINLTPFLSLITMHNIINSEIRVSYVVALHIWMFFCLFFTFLGLVEFFLALFADHVIKKRAKLKKWMEEQQESEKQGLLKEEKSADQTEKAGEKKGKEVKVRIPSESADETDVRPDVVIVNNRKKKTPVERVSVCSKIWQSMRVRMTKEWGSWKGKAGKKTGKNSDKKTKSAPKGITNPVDAVARPVVPICFLCFMLCYFLYFQNYSQLHSNAKTVVG